MTYRTVGRSLFGASDERLSVARCRLLFGAVSGRLGGLFRALDEDLGADELVQQAQRARVVRLLTGRIGRPHAADDVLDAANRSAILKEGSGCGGFLDRRVGGGRGGRGHGALAAAAGLGSARFDRLLPARTIHRCARPGGCLINNS